MKRPNRFLFLASTLAALIAVGCSDDESSGPGPDAAAGSSAGGEHSTEGPEVCEVLGTLCHAGDAGPGKISDCHDVGHVGDEASCEAQFTSCIGACVADEDGAGGAPSESVSNPYCQALGELCHFMDDQGTPTGDCHELGHIGNEPACIQGFDACAPLCITKRETEPTGHDGAGGAADGGGGESNHSEGGAGGSP